MLLEGGDTDTNACIVGGLVGAAVGFSNISPELSGGMLACSTKGGQSRPKFLVPKEVGLLDAVRSIYEKAEKIVTVLDGFDETAAKMQAPATKPTFGKKI